MPCHVVCFIELFINEVTSVNSGRTAQISGDSKVLGMSSPISFISMQFSEKNWPNNRLSLSPLLSRTACLLTVSHSACGVYLGGCLPGEVSAYGGVCPGCLPRRGVSA